MPVSVILDGMSAFRDRMSEWSEFADAHLPAGLYLAVSVPTERVRDQMRVAGRVFLGPDRPSVSMVDVDDTARWWIERSMITAAGISGIAAVGGLASVPPEAMGRAVSLVRLAQRLAITYGFDPEQERGQIAVWRALAAALEVELPAEGPMDVRVSDLRSLVAPAAALQSVGVSMVRSVMWRTLRQVSGGLMRWVPVVSPALSAISARRRVRESGARMSDALRRLAEVPVGHAVEDAVEIP